MLYPEFMHFHGNFDIVTTVAGNFEQVIFIMCFLVGGPPLKSIGSFSGFRVTAKGGSSDRIKFEAVSELIGEIGAEIKVIAYIGNIPERVGLQNTVVEVNVVIADNKVGCAQLFNEFFCLFLAEDLSAVENVTPTDIPMRSVYSQPPTWVAERRVSRSK